MAEGEKAIAAAIREALSDDFRGRLDGLVNPYGDGHASERILRALLTTPLDRLTRKPLMEPAPVEPDLDSMIVARGASLRETMETIQRAGSQIAFVIDPAAACWAASAMATCAAPSSTAPTWRTRSTPTSTGFRSSPRRAMACRRSSP